MIIIVVKEVCGVVCWVCEGCVLLNVSVLFKNDNRM